MSQVAGPRLPSTITKTVTRLATPRTELRLRAWKHRWWVGERELALLPSLVDRSRNAVDVGMCHGVYSFFLRRLARRVYGYEANPRLVPRLEQAFAGSNVEVRAAAASDRAGVVELTVPVVEGVDVVSWGSIAKRFEDVGAVRRFEVPARRLDEEGLEAVGFIKIDAEGAEGKVIAGATGLIDRDRPVLLVEIEQRHHADPITTVFEQITALGYAGSFLSGGQIRPLEEFDAERHGVAGPERVSNFIFHPR